MFDDGYGKRGTFFLSDAVGSLFGLPLFVLIVAFAFLAPLFFILATFKLMCLLMDALIAAPRVLSRAGRRIRFYFCPLGRGGKRLRAMRRKLSRARISIAKRLGMKVRDPRDSKEALRHIREDLGIKDVLTLHGSDGRVIEININPDKPAGYRIRDARPDEAAYRPTLPEWAKPGYTD